MHPTPELWQNMCEKIEQQAAQMVRLEGALARPAVSASKDPGEAEGPIASHPYRQAFCDYLKRGQEDRLQQWQSKSLTAGNDGEGGYLVSEPMQHHIQVQLMHRNAFRSLASVETISTDTLDLIEAHQHAASGWTTETAPRNETAAPRFQKRHIPVHEMYAQPQATQRLIDDAAIQIESWIEERIIDSFSRLESSSFLQGDGKDKPRGLLSYPEGSEWGQVEHLKIKNPSELNGDALLKLQGLLETEWSSQASFLAHRTTIQALRYLKDNHGQYVWAAGLASGQPATLFGRPIHEISDMPSLGSSRALVAYGDWKQAYQIVDRTGIHILRDPFTSKPFVKFYATKRVGGDVKNFRAFKVLSVA
jgi:HK97 family phage major capsid protein